VSPIELLPLVLLGAVLGLDVVSFPQAMISRPIVAATLAGAVVGSATDGLLVGAALELIALETLPFGASRYPEWGSAAVVGGALFAAQPQGRAGAMTLAVLAALATGWVGGYSMVTLRKLNARWAHALAADVNAGSRNAVVGLQMAGLLADLVRGALMTALALVLLLPTVDGALRLWGTNERVARAVVVGLTATVATAAVWKLFHAVPRARWLFAGGLLVGVGILVAL
jgi:mannose/fructose/N-acetylgalactosamine-specific phosphotransferase system component IIC